MRLKIKIVIFSTLGLTALAGCSSTTVVEEPPVIPEIPEYVKIPHPANFDMSSLQSIFFSPLAPKEALGEFSKNCDGEFQTLAKISTVPEERKKAAMELVGTDPERMHWCFYGKILKLQETLQGEFTWTERQKMVLETFAFLSPTANAFLDVYHDSRYLRWAAQYYSKISEWVFFRKVSQTPDSTLALISNSAPSSLEPWTPLENKNTYSKDSVFTKYGISLAPTVAGGINPVEQNNAARIPASAPTNATTALPAKAPPAPQLPVDSSLDEPETELKENI